MQRDYANTDIGQERKKSKRVRVCALLVSDSSAYLNSLDVNYTSGNNVYVLSRTRPDEIVSVGRLC